MFGEYAGYIIPSYLLTILVIGSIFVWIRLVYRSRRKELEALEAGGLKRRSAARQEANPRGS
jgi:heme exporter protein D